MYKSLNLHNRPYKVITAIGNNDRDLPETARQAKYDKMLASPYGFYRGTNYLFWEDFYNDWRLSLFGGTPFTQTWLQGDAHIYNLGAFANHYGEVIYGLDDFDDGIVGDYQYDLWRMAISIVLDGRENKNLDEKDIAKAVKEFAKSYLATITHYTPDEDNREIHFTKDNTSGMLQEFLEKVEKKESRQKMLEKWTTFDERGCRVFDCDLQKLTAVTTETESSFYEALDTYRQTICTYKAYEEDSHFQIKDVAKRLYAGTGSLGTPRYYVLIEGDEATAHDDIILDVKKQARPAAYQQMNAEEQEAYHRVFLHEGMRHATAFQAIAEHPDSYLGWMNLPDGVYSVRERSPFKEDFPTHKIKKGKQLREVASQWGTILATEHKRGGQTLNADGDTFLLEKAIKERTQTVSKKFVRFVVEVAFQYADCVAADYQTFVDFVGTDAQGTSSTIG